MGFFSDLLASCRLWLVESAEKQTDGLEGMLLHEIAVCGRVCDVYPKNYMAWTHRLAVVRKLGRAGKDAGRRQQLREELSRTREWAERHVSDHAGLHHLQSVLVLVSVWWVGGCVFAVFVDVFG